MPNVKTHCAISKERTGDEFKPLHEWIDEGTKFLKHNHRLERHFYTEEYKDFIKKKWGDKGVVEWLFHIAIDNIETANKFAFDTYNKSFDSIEFNFKDKVLSDIEFRKTFPTYVKTFNIDLKKYMEKEKKNKTKVKRRYRYWN